MNNLPNSKYDENGRPIKNKQNKSNFNFLSKNPVIIIFLFIAIITPVIFLILDPKMESSALIPLIIFAIIFIRIFPSFNKENNESNIFKFNNEMIKDANTSNNNQRENGNETRMESEYDEKKVDELIEKTNKSNF